MRLNPAATVVDGFPVAVTSDMGFMGDTSDMGTGVAERRAWTQAELDEIASRAQMWIAPDRIGAGEAAAGTPAAPASAMVFIETPGAVAEAAAVVTEEGASSYAVGAGDTAAHAIEAAEAASISAVTEAEMAFDSARHAPRP